MKIEIHIAQECNKPIIAVYSKKNNDVPREIRDASKVVGWQSTEIIGAITEYTSEL